MHVFCYNATIWPDRKRARSFVSNSAAVLSSRVLRCLEGKASCFSHSYHYRPDHGSGRIVESLECHLMDSFDERLILILRIVKR
jgi:hypothetical protein